MYCIAQSVKCLIHVLGQYCIPLSQLSKPLNQFTQLFIPLDQLCGSLSKLSNITYSGYITWKSLWSGPPVWHSVSCDYMYLSCLLSQLCAPLRTHNFYNCVSLSHLSPCELCAPLANLWVPPSYLISCSYHSVSCVHHWVSCIIQVSCQLWVMLLQLWNNSVTCVDNSTQLA